MSAEEQHRDEVLSTYVNVVRHTTLDLLRRHNAASDLTLKALETMSWDVLYCEIFQFFSVRQWKDPLDPDENDPDWMLALVDPGDKDGYVTQPYDEAIDVVGEVLEKSMKKNMANYIVMKPVFQSVFRCMRSITDPGDQQLVRDLVSQIVILLDCFNLSSKGK